MFATASAPSEKGYDQVILFKACPRCGGDIDATYLEDARCFQCSHRPDVAYPGPRVVEPKVSATVSEPESHPEDGAGAPNKKDGAQAQGSPTQRAATDPCPRCDSPEPIRLDKLRERDNTCFRCRLCGHIFSPSLEDVASESQATTS